MVFHVDGTLISEDHVVKTLTVLKALESEFQVFHPVCSSDELAILGPRLHPAKFLRRKRRDARVD